MVVRATEGKELDEPLVEHLLPLGHNVPLQVAERLLAREGDLEQLGELGRQRLVEEEEVAVATQDFPPSIKILSQFLIFNLSSPCFFPPDLEDIVDKLLACPVLPVQTDVLDLSSELTQLPASSASNTSVGTRSPVIVSPR